MGTSLIKNRKIGADPSKLTDKQRAFILELMGDSEFSATRAARAVGYANPTVAAHKLLKNRTIAAILGKYQREREERLQLRADHVVLELSDIAFRDVIDLCDEDGKLAVDDLRKLPEGIRRCIDSIKCKELFDKSGNVIGQQIELRLCSKLQALEMLGKHLGMFVEKKDVNVKIRDDWDKLLGDDSQAAAEAQNAIEGAILDVLES